MTFYFFKSLCSCSLRINFGSTPQRVQTVILTCSTARTCTLWKKIRAQLRQIEPFMFSVSSPHNATSVRSSYNHTFHKNMRPTFRLSRIDSKVKQHVHQCSESRTIHSYQLTRFTSFIYSYLNTVVALRRIELHNFRFVFGCNVTRSVFLVTLLTGQPRVCMKQTLLFVWSQKIKLEARVLCLNELFKSLSNASNLSFFILSCFLTS